MTAPDYRDLSKPPASLRISPYDPLTDLITIEGITYTGALFRELGTTGAAVGTVFRIRKRGDDGALYLEELTDR